MISLPWKKRKINRQLSAYLDGELDGGDTGELGERLVFDADLRRQLRAFERLSKLTQAALAPEQQSDSATFADRLTQSLDASPADRLPPEEPARPASGRRLKPAVLASIGILITAGITLAGLRRRGLA